MFTRLIALQPKRRRQFSERCHCRAVHWLVCRARFTEAHHAVIRSSPTKPLDRIPRGS
jgi:hypothetical protein